MMMKRKMVVAVCVVASACGTVAVASASASEFVFSKTGALKGSALTNQKFKNSLGSWACTKEKITGTVTSLKTATQKVLDTYEGCSFFGIPLTATAAELELNTNGSYKVLKAFTLSGTEGCKFTFPAQTVSTLTYANKPAGKIEITSAVSKITSWGVGGPAGLCEYAENSGTTLTGTSSLELEGGTAEVK